jgi:hypothetical protein
MGVEGMASWCEERVVTVGTVRQQSNQRWIQLKSEEKRVVGTVRQQSGK